MTRVQFVVGLCVVSMMALAGGFLGIVALGSGGVLQAQEARNVIETNEIRLRGPDGKLRALFTVDDEHNVLFTMLDRDEKIRITQMVSGTEDEGSVVIHGQDGKPRISLTSSGTQASSVSLFDDEGEIGAMLALADGKYPALGFSSGGQDVGKFAYTQEGGFFNIASPGHETGISMAAGEDSVMRFNNGKGGNAFLINTRANGQMLWSMTEKEKLLAFTIAGGETGTYLQLDSPQNGGSIQLQAQRNGRALMQLENGEHYIRAMQNADGTSEISKIAEGRYRWRAPNE